MNGFKPVKILGLTGKLTVDHLYGGYVCGCNWERRYRGNAQKKSFDRIVKNHAKRCKLK